MKQSQVASDLLLLLMLLTRWAALPVLDAGVGAGGLGGGLALGPVCRLLAAFRGEVLPRERNRRNLHGAEASPLPLPLLLPRHRVLPEGRSR